MSTGRELAVIEPATGELVHEYVAPQPMTFAEVVDRLATDEALEQQQKLMTAYDRACRALISENDIQREGRREFKKKSAWRKLARAFAISTQIVRTERWWDEDPNGARHFVARVIVRGVAPWGQSVEAVGLCSTRETRFRSNAQRAKADHDCEATAATRATNRAISDLIAAGEVSAEEVEAEPNGDPMTAEQRRRLEELAQDDALTEAQRERLAVWLESDDITEAAAADAIRKAEKLAGRTRKTDDGED